MTKLTYLPAGEAAVECDAMDNATLMENALIHDVQGILGLCGGICSCATCHVVLAPEWASKVPPPSAEERDMLDGIENRQPHSRLGCQVMVTPDLAGLIIEVPPES